MSKVITLLFWRRPDYARRVLEHLKNCLGISEYHLSIVLDGPPRYDMNHLCSGIKFAPHDVKQLRANMGCNFSTREALRRGFERSDYVIHIEEDVIVAPDALRYFEWAKQFGDDKKLMTVAAWRHSSGWLPGSSPYPPNGSIEGKVRHSGGFTCWGWATWLDRWAEMDQNWSKENDHKLSWDVRLEEIRRIGHRHQLMPLISRAMNIGRDYGIHRRDCLLPFWAGTRGFTIPKEYCLIPPAVVKV